MNNKNKLTYNKPDLEHIKFDYTDIITSSICNGVWPDPTPPDGGILFNKLKDLLDV